MPSWLPQPDFSYIEAKKADSEDTPSFCENNLTC